MSFEPCSGVVLTEPASIDAALAFGGLARPPGVPLELWLASLTDDVPDLISWPPSGRPDEPGSTPPTQHQPRRCT